MKKKIQFISRNNKLDISFLNDVSISKLLKFGEPLSLENGRLDIERAFFIDHKIKRYFTNLANEYTDKNPSFKRLEAFFSRTENESVVFVLTKSIEDDYILSLLKAYLKLFEENQELSCNPVEKEVISQIKRIFEKISNDYYIYSPPTITRREIGEKKKNERICRFCGLSINTGVTFNKRAHAIPESLGNKGLILNEECDSCNEYFGNKIEPHLIEYLNLYRVVSGARSKKGHPKIKMDRANIFYSDDKVNIQTDAARLCDDGSIELIVESNNFFIPLRVYKGLCKIIISTLPDFKRDSFGAVLTWLLDPNNQSITPPYVYLGLISCAKSEPPCAVINFERKKPSNLTPSLFCELRIGEILLIFSLPEKNNQFDMVKNAIDTYPWSENIVNLNRLDFSNSKAKKIKHKIIRKS